MIKTKKQMFIVIGVFTLIMILGTTSYAFFNYTRKGQANSVTTGRIYFNMTQNGGVLNLTNVFPVESEDLDESNMPYASVRIYGDTTYSGGEEYEITLTDVHNTVNNKTIPIEYIASYAANGNGKTVGTEDSDYFENKGGNSQI